jgi:hypothetical protein
MLAHFGFSTDIGGFARMEHVAPSIEEYKTEGESHRSEGSCLGAALRYAALGLAVLPCDPKDDKIYAGDGIDSATVARARILDWWTQWPDANVAIATGHRWNVMVVEMDARHGGDRIFFDLATRYGGLRLAPPVAYSYDGGLRMFFSCPSSVRSGILDCGIYVSANGGYVIAPPSLSGGRRYSWDLDLDSTDLPPAPSWLLKRLAQSYEAIENQQNRAPRFLLKHSIPALMPFRYGLAIRSLPESHLPEASHDTGSPDISGRTQGVCNNAGANEACSEYHLHRSQHADKPEIIVAPGFRPEYIDQAERILVAHAAEQGIFQHAGQIVQVTLTGKENNLGGLRRPAGNIALSPVTVLSLQETLDRIIHWRKAAGPQLRSVDCPKDIPATYLARIGEWKLPHLVGIIGAPIMRGDGSILRTRGFDKTTGLFLAGPDWPMPKDSPSEEDARAALRELMRPFAEFPFVDAGAASVYVSAILTALQRRLLASAPLFAFDAPTQRTGKSLLAESLSIIAIGRRPSATAVANNEEELRKVITSALWEGQPTINLDNVIGPLRSPDLARALTQSEYADRLLGTNRLLRLPTNVLWTATGNNLVFTGDLTCRVLVCRLDAQTERPEERVFRIPDLSRYILAHRVQIVTAALTIVKAFFVAGQPAQRVRHWGGFEQWSRQCREPLIWLGMTDPCQSRDRALDRDPDREGTVALLERLFSRFGSREISLGEIKIESSTIQAEGNLYLSGFDQPGGPTLRCCSDWCCSVEDRVFAGFRLTRVHPRTGIPSWKVQRIGLESVALEKPGSAGPSEISGTKSSS